MADTNQNSSKVKHGFFDPNKSTTTPKPIINGKNLLWEIFTTPFINNKKTFRDIVLDRGLKEACVLSEVNDNKDFAKLFDSYSIIKSFGLYNKTLSNVVIYEALPCLTTMGDGIKELMETTLDDNIADKLQKENKKKKFSLWAWIDKDNPQSKTIAHGNEELVYLGFYTIDIDKSIGEKCLVWKQTDGHLDMTLTILA